MQQHANPGYELHGYHPVVVDETCLGPEERRQALLDATTQPQDWLEFLTPSETAALEKDLAQIEAERSPFVIGASQPRAERIFEASRLGMLRAYARHKYCAGRRIWLGDRPPWRRASKTHPLRQTSGLAR